MTPEIVSLLIPVATGVTVGAITTTIGAGMAKSARDSAKSESLAEFRGAIVAEMAQLSRAIERLEKKMDSLMSQPKEFRPYVGGKHG